MLGGVAMDYSTVPLSLIQKHGLARRVVCRGGEPEVQFRLSDPEPVLPVWHEGHLRLVTWGNRRGESRRLPYVGWTWLQTVEEGKWRPWSATAVDIPATMLLDGQVWYCVQQGFRALLVRDEDGVERIFGLAEEASFYYKIMTRGKWMPVLIGQRI